ncbi:MAG: prealbumin-like fold domain-containing protein [Atopobiaceae bacterium]|nr:prealbumin-like fold domain-containing protein [Atopobiaceae bacterium]
MRGGGSLQVESSSGSSAVYRAVRIASEDALPINDALAWADVAGQQVGDHQAFPSYDPDSSDALAQGRDLVVAVSDEIARDDDGTLATWLTDFVAPDAASVEVASDAGAVPVQDGWWLLTASGRRPLLAWVDGEAVTLGDKSDVPALEKQVYDPETGEWGDSSIYGGGRPLEFRLVVSVPDSFAGFRTYNCAFHDSWGERLSLVEDSVCLTLVSGDGETDITGSLDLRVEKGGLTATIDDLCKTAAAPGDKLVLTYQMVADPTANPGADGLVNSAWFTFPSWEGEGTTLPDRTRSYAFRLRVRKASPDGGLLEGAIFALRNEEGLWLAADGSFGAQEDRLTFATGENGVTGETPLVPAGSYALVELEAPQGYRLPSDPTFAFVLSADHSFDRVDLSAEASGAIEVETVDARETEVTLKLVNQPQTPPGTPLGIPVTGDVLPVFGGLLLLAALAVLGTSRATRRGLDSQKTNDHQVDE